jgi:hypothetical protein
VGARLPLLALAVVEIMSRRRRPAGQENWISCLYLLAQPLVTPRSEVHDLVYAFPAAGLPALRSLPAGSGSRARFRLVGLAAAWLLLVGGRIDRDGPYFFLALCLLGGLVTAEALASPAPRAPEERRPVSALS